MRIIKKNSLLNNKYKYSELEYLLYKICYHGAPTIFRVKPSSLICFKNNKLYHLKCIWDKYKYMLADIIPCNYCELKRCKNGVKVLFYWGDWLDKLLRIKENKEYLKSVGYGEHEDINQTLNILIKHYEERCPHEIGIFLGYPLSDVIAFSSNKKREFIGVGYWKVYSNLNRANQIFKLYDQARYEMINTLESGIKPQQLLKAM